MVSFSLWAHHNLNLHGGFSNLELLAPRHPGYPGHFVAAQQWYWGYHGFHCWADVQVGLALVEWMSFYLAHIKNQKVHGNRYYYYYYFFHFSLHQKCMRIYDTDSTKSIYVFFLNRSESMYRESNTSFSWVCGLLTSLVHTRAYLASFSPHSINPIPFPLPSHRHPFQRTWNITFWELCYVLIFYSAILCA